MKVRPALFETKEQAKFGDIILSTRNRLHKTLAINSINKKQLIVLIQLDSVLNDTDIKEGDLYYFDHGWSSGITMADNDDIEQLHLELNPRKVITDISEELKEQLIIEYNKNGNFSDLEI